MKCRTCKGFATGDDGDYCPDCLGWGVVVSDKVVKGVREIVQFPDESVRVVPTSELGKAFTALRVGYELIGEPTEDCDIIGVDPYALGLMTVLLDLSTERGGEDTWVNWILRETDEVVVSPDGIWAREGKAGIRIHEFV